MTGRKGDAAVDPARKQKAGSCTIGVPAERAAKRVRQQFRALRQGKLRLSPAELPISPFPLPVAVDFPDTGRWQSLNPGDRSKASDRALHGEERSEASRVGKECVSTCRSRWSPNH